MACSKEELTGVLLPSAARTVATDSEAMMNDALCRGLFIYFDCTVYAAGGVTPSLQWFNPATQEWETWLSATKITATGETSWAIYPTALGTDMGATDEDNAAIPCGTWRLHMAVDDANPITYSVGYTYLP